MTIRITRWYYNAFPVSLASAPEPFFMHKVLVVDDDAEIGRLVASYLRQNGFGVRVAGAEEGMRQMLAAEPPDLLVLDLMLPGKDGLTIIKELRADPVTALLPVLMLGVAPLVRTELLPG